MANLLNAILDATAYLTQRGIDLPEGTAVAIKRWQIERAGFEGIKTIAYYDRSLSRAVRDFYGGEIDASEFIDEMIRLVEGQLTRAWNEGMRGNGLDPRKDMTDAWRGILQGEINSEMDHILDYAGQIEQAAANQAPIAPLMGRVALWVNRYQDVLNLALITTAKQEDRFKWIYGDTQHCETCASLNGIVATKAQWDASGFRPQNPPNQMLDCGGWRCQCRLEKTDSPSFGHIPGLSVKYDPDQPRDELGRWTDGGGGVDRAGYQIPGSMGANVFSEKEARFVWNMTRDETREYIKARGADEIAKDTDLTSWEASRYQEAWAGASNNGGGPQDALQILASEMSGDHAPLEPEQLEVQNDEDTMGKASEVFDSVYLRTQAYFESQGLGPNDTIVVYRGMTLDQDIDNAEDVRWRPLSSWSLDQSTAESFAVADLMMPGFGGSWGHVFAMRVKVSDIFSHWSTGFGCANEQEVVLFGKHNPTVKVIKSMYYNDDNWREKT